MSKYLTFVKGISINNVSKTGVVLTTSSFVTFIIFQLAEWLGLVTNAYIGLIIYVAFPLMFIIGLILIPVGWRISRKSRHKRTRELLEDQFSSTEIQPGLFGSKLIQTILYFTVMNILFISIVSLQTVKYMDRPEFCGTACHNVMGPEWATYQQSPHARVKCVECHVGEGAEANVGAKLNGVRRMFLASLSNYSKPIPTPVHTLRPSQDTCEKCHWPDKFYGTRIKDFVHYGTDEESTPFYNTIALKVETSKPGGKAGIHWHISEKNEVRYASVDDKRHVMIWVEARTPEGVFRHFTNPNIDEGTVTTNEVRTLDCVDCHNRPSHIFEVPETAIDSKLETRLIDSSLPYIKREALTAITRDYPDKQTALDGIASHIWTFYNENYPELASQKVASINASITELQEIYDRNIHPDMNIFWNTYPNFIGHHNDSGCLRCHNDELVDETGETISGDCSLCHTILAYEEDAPHIVQ